MALSAAITLKVRHMEDVLWSRQEIRRFAAGLPFSIEDVSRLEVAVSELASNMVKHAGGGTLTVSRLERGDGVGLRLVAEDRGPGIADVEAALRPGVSSAGTLGIGLASVAELLDQFEIRSEPGHGTRVEGILWVN